MTQEYTPRPFALRPVSNENEVTGNSDIDSIHYDEHGLVVTVAMSVRADGYRDGLRVHFDHPIGGMRMLDEFSLVRFWSAPGFVGGHYVIEVLAGGWEAEEKALIDYDTRVRREWLIGTGNNSLSVFCSTPPVLTYLTLEPI